MFIPATVITVFNWLLFLFCLSQMFPPPSFALWTCMYSSSTVQLQPSRCKSLLPFGQHANENPPGLELLPYAYFKGGAFKANVYCLFTNVTAPKHWDHRQFAITVTVTCRLRSAAFDLLWTCMWTLTLRWDKPPSSSVWSIRYKPPSSSESEVFGTSRLHHQSLKYSVRQAASSSESEFLVSVTGIFEYRLVMSGDAKVKWGTIWVSLTLCIRSWGVFYTKFIW